MKQKSASEGGLSPPPEALACLASHERTARWTAGIWGSEGRGARRFVRKWYLRSKEEAHLRILPNLALLGIMELLCCVQRGSRNVDMSKPGQHVVPNGDKWSVRRAGSAKASGTFSTQREAIDRARDVARNQGTEVFIHGRDGRIRERDSYGNDPHPPKG